MLLLDASVWVAAAIEADPRYADAAAIARGGTEVGALDLTIFEVLNAVAGRYRQPEQARLLVETILRTCGDRLLRIDQGLAEEITRVLEQYRLSAYDAAYVAAARRYGWQLVSLDVRDLVSKGLAVTPDAALYP